jgi:hypothetical protein
MVAAAVVGSAVVGGIASSSASSKAAKAQQKSAADANATQLKMFNQSRDDQAPWRAYGEGGLNELAYRLGISAPGSTGAGQANQLATASQTPQVAQEIESYGSIRNRLMPQYMEMVTQLGGEGDSVVRAVNNAKLESAIDAEMKRQQSTVNAAPQPSAPQQAVQQGAARPGQQNDPNFGSLLRDFSLADFEKDPGYDFRMAEGMKGITNSAAARGGLLSGAALKAAGRYNQDFASNEFGNAYNRFNNNKTNQFNRLASLAGVGQQAATQIGNQGIATGQSMAQNQIGAGNARASGYIGQSNALTGAIGQGWNMYQGNKMMGMFGNQGGNSMAGYNGAYSNLDYDVGNMS